MTHLDRLHDDHQQWADDQADRIEDAYREMCDEAGVPYLSDRGRRLWEWRNTSADEMGGAS